MFADEGMHHPAAACANMHAGIHSPMLIDALHRYSLPTEFKHPTSWLAPSSCVLITQKSESDLGSVISRRNAVAGWTEGLLCTSNGVFGEALAAKYLRRRPAGCAAITCM